MRKELHHEIKAGCQKEFELDFKNKEEYQKLIKGKNDLDNKVILLEKDLKNLQINQKQIITLEKSEIEKQLNQKFFAQIEELKFLLKEKEITITKLQAKVQVDISEAEKRATIKAVNNLITTHNLEKQGLNQKILTLQNELTQYKRQLSSNVKIRGQDLENWVANEIENAFGTDDYFRFEREKTYFQQDYEDRKTVRKRADFELQFLNYLQIPNQEKEPLANNQNKQVVFKVIIECKTVLDDGVVSSAKNKEYYHQLISYAKIAQASYGILVSELERNGENDWLIYQVKNEEIVKNNPELTLFVVRPEMLVPLLLLLKKFSMTEAKLTLKSNSVKAKAQMKQAILVEYEKFKEDLLTTTFKYIKDDYKKITD